MSDHDYTDEMVQLAQRLVARTREGRIAWDSTEDSSRYSYSGQSSSVWIEGGYDTDNDFNGALTLLNTGGEIVEVLRTDYTQVGNKYESGPHNAVLEELHRAARRKALDIDRILSETLLELE